MPQIYDITNPRTAETMNKIPFEVWLQVLARPHVFQMLTRPVSREHLLMLCEAYLPYARSRRELVKEQGYLSHVDDELLFTELAERMRALLAAWSPDSLPPEIVDTARALLIAGGTQKVLDLDFTPELEPGQTLDDMLIGPSNPWSPLTTSPFI